MSETWIVGVNPVAGALRNDPARIREIRVEHGTRNARVQALAQQARQAGVMVRTVPRPELDALAGGQTRHQGVAAAYAVAAALSEADLPQLITQAGATALFLVLDGVTDPHNLGACLRSAAAAAVTAVIIPADRAVALTPAARKAAAGGAEQVPLVRVTNLARALRVLREGGVWLTGLAGDAQQSLYQVDFNGPAALVMGSEGEGMRRLTREACDFLALIPMPGGMESLNVSVATGVALFEVLRQRSRGPKK